MQGLAPMARTGIQSWHCGLEYNKWIQLSPSGLPPVRRYKHAAIMSDDKLYVIGGARVGRYLSDFQVLDLNTLTWSTVKLKMEATDKDGPQLEGFPEISGHSMIKWKKRLLLVAGLTKSNSDKVAVRSIDLESCTCGVVETFGNIPVSRGGQSVTLFGSKLIMFGGEDWKGIPLNDVHVLDLETMTWSAVTTSWTRPTPRFDHVAVLHSECYLYIFGGSSRTLSFADLHVLDLESMEWLHQQMQDYTINPRAGHAGVAVDGNWYIVGSKSGAVDTLAINMTTRDVSVLTTVKERDPLASEGISISSATLGGENFLITFGGYNGKYLNEVFAMRIKPNDSAHELSNSETMNISTKNKLGFIKTQVDTSLQDLANGINSAKGKNVLESPLAVCTTNYSANKSKIREVGGSAYKETTKESHSAHVPQHPQKFQSGFFLKKGPQHVLLPPPGFSSPLPPPGFSSPLPPPGFTSPRASGPSMNKEFTTVPQTQLAARRSPIDHKAETSAQGAKKRACWLKVEDKVLSHSIMIVAAQGVSVNFWGSVANIYNVNKPEGAPHRTSDVIRSHWHSMKWKIHCFNGIYNSLSSASESSLVSQEMMLLAHKEYRKNYGCEFVLDHVWIIIKDHPALAHPPIDPPPICTKKARTEQLLPTQTLVMTSNPSSNHNTNAGDTCIFEDTRAMMMAMAMAMASKSLSNLDVNACPNLNEGSDAQIIGHEMIKFNTELQEELRRWLCMKEYDVIFKDTSQMTEEQRGIHAKACERIKQYW